MLLQSRHRLIDPRLGAFFGIFASAMASMLCLLLILEKLGIDDDTVRVITILAPTMVCMLLGLVCYAREPEDYFVAGRSVPSVLNAAATTVSMFGVTGLCAIAGSFFLIGIDAMAMVIGVMIAIMVLAILLAPYFRKYGAFTVSAYLARRFSSRTIRLLAAVLTAVPVLLVLIAELKLGIGLAVMMLERSTELIAWCAGTMVLASGVLGGWRGLARANGAQAIIVLVGILVPLMVLSTSLTNLPVPQLTYGQLLEDVGRLESAHGMADQAIRSGALNLPDGQFYTLSTQFLDAFGAFGAFGFFALAICFVTGISTLPTTLVRTSMTPSVFDARKAMGWTAFLAGFILLSIPAVAVFTRYMFLSDVIGTPIDQLPGWLVEISRLGYIALSTENISLGLADIRFSRDTSLLLLPIAAGHPVAVVHLTGAALIAAAFAGASASAMALANILADDLIFGVMPQPPSNVARLTVARLVFAVVVSVTTLLAINIGFDPLTLLIWGLSISGSTLFVVLIMSVWWKRINAIGALLGLTVGFGVCVVSIFCAEMNLFPIDLGGLQLVAGMLGLPAGLAAALIGSLIGEGPSKETREFIRDLRVPGGETIYDRETRLASGERRRKS